MQNPRQSTSLISLSSHHQNESDEYQKIYSDQQQSKNSSFITTHDKIQKPNTSTANFFLQKIKNHFVSNSSVWLTIIIIVLSFFLFFQILLYYLCLSQSTETLKYSHEQLVKLNQRQNQDALNHLNDKEVKQTLKNQILNDPQSNIDNSVKSSKQNEQKIISAIKQSNQKKKQISLITPTVGKIIANITLQQRQQAKKWLKMSQSTLQKLDELIQQQFNYYQNKYSISKYQELPFCIVVPSFNNAKNNRHIKNMKSIITQNYTNYHIVFIDDASTDQTVSQIQNYLKTQTTISPSKYQIIKNQQNRNAMPNLRRAALQFCKPEQIYMIVDGDDELIGRQVFKLFNSIFQQKKVWFAYSNFLSIRGTVGYSRNFTSKAIQQNSYRTYPFVTSHLRAFYTQLFVNIREEDLKDQSGKYLKAANDVAICLPILQQSHLKVAYIPELTYLYNSNTGLNNHAIRLKQQKSNEKMIRRKKRYEALQKLFP